ncbi:type II toxin-antitoxin system death-on-curing family toxin [Streptomyces sp. DHE17-7]|uniref:type II toxin-antitoxin system death-on-curing family toxin n=1 Tax=Streptomyces sp. DHE17-7 TaxID=2759949 RepID=UPI0022EABB43|nr:toxin [Streptomyces sp. DHE17-7]
MSGVRYLQIDEILAIVRTVNGAEHSVRDMGLLVSAIERPRTNVFGAELYPTREKRGNTTLHSVASHPTRVIDGNKRTAWLAMRVFLRFNGASASTVPPHGRRPDGPEARHALLASSLSSAAHWDRRC